ncbi:MAG: HDOD domain-containing protein [Desulforhopalus sp.]
MSDIRANEEIQKLIGEQIQIPTPPTIAVQILNTVQDSESSLGDLEKIISADPALTSKMLQIANSAFYSLPNEVNTISRALSILGTNVIKNIALSFVIPTSLRGESTTFFDFDYFWRRSVTSAVAAELLVKLLRERNEDIFVTAILQDLGILLMFLSKGQEYAVALKESFETVNASLIELERKKYKFDHQQLGFTLLSDWSIPTSITMPMQFHHEPEKAPEEYRKTANVLMAANLMSAIYTSGNTGERVQELQVMMEETFNFEPEKTQNLLDDVARNSVDILQIFDIDPGLMKPYSQMLQEANDALGKLNLSYEQLVLELQESKEKAERFANELREANVQLEQLASRDGLTNLYNHRYFQDILGQEIARSKRYGRPLSLIMFDIDFFKKVNDTYGHPAGDQVLVNLAEAISNAVRPNDIIARYGGEEFAVILPETNRTGMKVFAERMRRCVEGVTTTVKGSPIKVTISGGGTEFSPDSGVSQQDLLDSADRGLYMSKENGRNRITIVDLK